MRYRFAIWTVLAWLAFGTASGQEAPSGSPPPVEPESKQGQQASSRPKLEHIYPSTVYPSEENNGFDFWVVGENLAKEGKKTIVEVAGEGPVGMGDPKDCETAKKDHKYDKPCLEDADPSMRERKLRVVGFQAWKYRGPIQVQVRVNGNVSDPVSVTFAKVSVGAVRLWAVVIFAAVVLVVLRLVWGGIGGYEIDGKTYTPWTSLFLDKQTNSYSLSKFQLLLWTLVVVFGYLYVFLCRVLIQWNFDFPPVPDGLPGLFAISAGTTVAAAGITGTLGSKGAGPIHPSVADFISTGGLVVGERFQFFVWTLIGAFGFLSPLIRIDPSILKELPKVPDGFLYLMGISSTGYLGGKMVRKPGPIIRSIDARVVNDAAPTALEVKLAGENLSRTATFQLNDERVPNDQTEIVDKTPQGQDADLCTMLKVRLNSIAQAYFEGPHMLRIINGDAQAAEAKYGATVESIKDIPQGNNPVPVSVIGRNFKDPSSARWRGADVPAENVTKKSETELLVTLTPGAQGTGRLTIVSPGGLTTSADVSVV